MPIRPCELVHASRNTRPITFSVRPTRCAATVICLDYGLRMVAASTPVRHKSCCRAIKTRATKRSIAFFVAEARPFDSGIFSVPGALSTVAGDGGRSMLELWNNWYETLASVEALATVIVIVVVAAGLITLVEGRRR